MKDVFEYLNGQRFSNLDELVYTLKDAGYAVEDVTTQYVTIWDDDKMITLMLGGTLTNFHVCY